MPRNSNCYHSLFLIKLYFYLNSMGQVGWWAADCKSGPLKNNLDTPGNTPILEYKQKILGLLLKGEDCQPAHAQHPTVQGGAQWQKQEGGRKGRRRGPDAIKALGNISTHVELCTPDTNKLDKCRHVIVTMDTICSLIPPCPHKFKLCLQSQVKSPNFYL